MSTRAQPVGMSCRATQSRQSTRPFGFRAFVPRPAWTSMIACVCARLRFLLEQRPAGLRAPYTWARAQCYAMLPSEWFWTNFWPRPEIDAHMCRAMSPIWTTTVSALNGRNFRCFATWSIWSHAVAVLGSNAGTVVTLAVRSACITTRASQSQHNSRSTIADACITKNSVQSWKR